MSNQNPNNIADGSTPSPAPISSDPVAAQRAHRLALAAADRRRHDEATRNSARGTAGNRSVTTTYDSATGTITEHNAQREHATHGSDNVLNARSLSGRAVNDLHNAPIDTIVTMRGQELPISVAVRLGWLRRTEGGSYQPTDAGGAAEIAAKLAAKPQPHAVNALIDKYGPGAVRTISSFITDGEDALEHAGENLGLPQAQAEQIVTQEFGRLAASVGNALSAAGLGEQASTVRAMNDGPEAERFRGAMDALILHNDSSQFVAMARSARMREVAATERLANMVDPMAVCGEREDGTNVYFAQNKHWIEFAGGERMPLAQAVGARRVVLS